MADNGGNSAYDNNDDAVEVGKSMENVAMPVVDSENVSVVKSSMKPMPQKKRKKRTRYL